MQQKAPGISVLKFRFPAFPAREHFIEMEKNAVVVARFCSISA
jgi:hypothetical protein